MNKEAERIFGYTKEEITKLSYDDLVNHIHPDDRAMAQQQAQRLIDGEEPPRENKVRFVLRDGTVKTLITYVRPIIYKGRPALHQVFLDIARLQ